MFSVTCSETDTLDSNKETNYFVLNFDKNCPHTHPSAVCVLHQKASWDVVSWPTLLRDAPQDMRVTIARITFALGYHPWVDNLVGGICVQGEQSTLGHRVGRGAILVGLHQYILLISSFVPKRGEPSTKQKQVYFPGLWQRYSQLDFRTHRNTQQKFVRIKNVFWKQVFLIFQHFLLIFCPSANLLVLKYPSYASVEFQISASVFRVGITSHLHHIPVCRFCQNTWNFQGKNWANCQVQIFSVWPYSNARHTFRTWFPPNDYNFSVSASWLSSTCGNCEMELMKN